MRYLITFSYDGSNYNGYQKQPNLRTIQSSIEDALKFINGLESVDIHASGRTDKGVHAINQKAHFDLNKNITLYKLKCALNTYTDKDIYIKNVEVVDASFHARYMVKKKEYIYKLNMCEYRFIGNGFLKYQVRNMVGALIEVSTKNKTIDYILKSKDRCSFGKTAGAEGLYLNNVEY